VAAAELARASGVEQLVLFHHDPTRDDAGVAAMEAETQGLFAATVAAREGATFRLGRGGSPRKLVA
jgi:ribonuclease BN (tRNA processing enzyme)